MTALPPVPAPARLVLDGDALVANWRLMRRLGGGAACGAAVKADGYGLGAGQVARRLAEAGCRDFFVATWAEALALAPLGLSVSVLHGVRDEDMAAARSGVARPVLNTPAQVARWRAAGGGGCDAMVDTGINRLGLSAADVGAGALDGLELDVLMSHLARADEDVPDNARQRDAFAAAAGRARVRRLSLANSAGIALGREYAFDLTRPGLALYGGRPRAGLQGIVPVVRPQAQVLQRRRVGTGEGVGYNAEWRAPAGGAEVAVLNLGYADGYRLGFTNRGAARWNGTPLPVAGRVSMDLTALDATAAPQLAEGDWVEIDFDLARAAAASGASQYELLTGLGARWERAWA